MPEKTSHSVARTAENYVAPVVARQLIPITIVGIGLWFLWDQVPEFNLTLIWQTLHQVSPRQWALALVATLISFWAVARYDQLIHGLWQTGTDVNSARISGAAAVAVAQFVGFGVLSSALVRWRLLPELSLSQSLKLSLAVSLTFLSGWAVVASFTLLATGVGTNFLRFGAIAILLIFFAVFLLLLLQPRSMPNLPGLMALCTVLLLAFVDTFFAGAALYILLPGDLGITPVTLMPAFLIALGCGLVGGTPGGVGPFEIALLAMLPQFPDEPVLASVLAFRMVYFVVPAVVSLLVLTRGLRPQNLPALPLLAKRTKSAYLSPKHEALLWKAPRAEMNLIRQGRFTVLCNGGPPTSIVAAAGQSLLMLSDPMDRTTPVVQSLQALHRMARQLSRPAMVYKCSARTAIAARNLGWKILPVMQEAWLNPCNFSTNGTKFRQLRRLLRKAEKAGVTVLEGGRALPLDDMQEISQNWAAQHGGERGFTMGRFDQDYVNCQRVFLAYQDEKLIAFITLHEVQQEWTLDLMRQSDSIPNGTIHLLVGHAIQSAAAIGCPRLSLAAVPCPRDSEAFPLSYLRHKMIGYSKTDGLRRFKTSFAPNWETLYAAAPSRVSLSLGLVAVFTNVTRCR